ncbi:hypothetical protein P5673_033102 [Acropora cervicornis]|uniref:Uncharacterized protein n=1 Tax=Acropora cervicornis TaxID=6130 RepID=A0AAD9PQR2_ACRCE|nr:hypothetical protein P5673_033102 [Acropora cervicornis]
MDLIFLQIKGSATLGPTAYKGRRIYRDRLEKDKKVTLFKSNNSENDEEKTLMDCLRTGTTSWLGRVGEVEPPFLVLPLTVEPTKSRLCHNARFLDLWMEDNPFTLHTLNDLPRYMTKDSYQTVLDDKSGYDHILLLEDSRTFGGIQWGGCGRVV